MILIQSRSWVAALKKSLRKWLISEVDRLELQTVEAAQQSEMEVDWKKNILDFRAMMNELKFVVCLPAMFTLY